MAREHYEMHLYNRQGTDHRAAWAKMSKQIHPPNYPPSFEVFEHELIERRRSGARMTAIELSDEIIERAKKRTK